MLLSYVVGSTLRPFRWTIFEDPPPHCGIESIDRPLPQSETHEWEIKGVSTAGLGRHLRAGVIDIV